MSTSIKWTYYIIFDLELELHGRMKNFEYHFRARRRSLFPLGANKPVLEQMARRRFRFSRARTVAGHKSHLQGWE
jgi:hypothetical protein